MQKLQTTNSEHTQMTCYSVAVQSVISKMPEFYMILAQKMPEIYIIIARKIFFPEFWGARAPTPLPQSSHTPMYISRSKCKNGYQLPGFGTG